MSLFEVSDFYAALVESSDDAIVAKDLDGRVIAWNPAAERLFGYSAREIVGGSIRRLLPEERQDEEDRILERIRAGLPVGQFFTRRLHKDGHEIDVSVRVSPVRNAAGQVIGASKIARDATQYLENERRLRESEERFRMLAENMSQFAWIARPDGHIFWYNKRWYDYTGTTLEQMEGWGWKSVHHPDHVDRVEQVIRHAFETGTDWEDLFPLRGADGHYRWFLSRALPIRDADGVITAWFGTNTDITEQRDQSEQIRLLLNEVNHRSKNMLGTVQALARRTARNGGDDFVSRFENRVRSLSVNQDILVRRQWREVPMDELVHGQLDFLTDSPGELEVQGPDCSVSPAAAEVIGMALHELATNALKYGALSVPEGRVSVTWGLSDEGELSVEWTETGGPPVAEPIHKGFGTTIISEVPRRHIARDVRLEYRPEGVYWRVECLPSAITEDDQAA